MTQNKRIIGITGGSGAGKSHISQELRKKGFTVIDADEVAHKIINESACKEELCAYFGTGILNGSGIDRKKLGKIVFHDAEKLAKLNEIAHKYILSDIAEKIETAESDTVFVDGAVLIESGMKCDVMIGVLADKKVRISRIMRRDGITEEAAKERICAQKANSFYEQNCDIIVTNNGGKVDVSEILKRVEQ